MDETNPVSGSGTRQFRLDINALRAIAVTAVVLFHFKLGFLPGGFAGVDVFFVISGFLMTSIIWTRLLDDRFSLVDFYIARARRIVPALLVLCLTLIAFGAVWFDPLAFRDLGAEVVNALLFVSNFGYWWQAGYFDTASDSKILLHTWSLSVEWQFYLAYPLVLMALHRFFGRSAKHLIAMGAALSFALAVFSATRKPDFDFYLLPTRAWEMAAGGLLCLYRVEAPRSPVAARFLVYGGLGAIACSLILVEATMPWPSWATLAPVAGTLAVIAANHDARWLFGARPVKAVGAWSYSIYLWHWPAVAILGYFDLAGLPAKIAAMVLVLVLSASSYHLVESGRSRWFALRDPRSRRLAVSFLTSGLILAGVIEVANGFPTRFKGEPSRIEAIAQAEQDWDFPAGCGGMDVRAHRLRQCRLGHGPRKVMLFGDSYAEQLYPRMAELARRHEDLMVRLVTKGGCPPVPGVDLMVPAATCSLFNAVADEEAVSGHYDVVVLASVWAPYFRTDDQQAADVGKLCDAAGGTCRRPLRKDALLTMYSAAFERLADFIRRLDHLGTKVVIVAPTPFPPDGARGLPRELVRRNFLGLDTSPIDHIDLADFRSRTRYVRERLQSVAAATGATFIDPALSLCSETSCATVDQAGLPLLRDNAHFRSTIIARAPLERLDQAILSQPLVR